ncbi:MAG: hypothetical protein N3A61_03170, partial [Ignavibacteria bacterium]|nr:hypothetical protein [Ignavibacteria bacterium]
MLRKIKIIWFVAFVVLVFIGIMLGRFIYAIYMVPADSQIQKQTEYNKNLQAQTDSLDYEFPLKDYRYITSTFFDFRENHIHGAVD